jgi:hypothetical protein
MATTNEYESFATELLDLIEKNKINLKYDAKKIMNLMKIKKKTITKFYDKIPDDILIKHMIISGLKHDILVKYVKLNEIITKKFYENLEEKESEFSEIIIYRLMSGNHIIYRFDVSSGSKYLYDYSGILINKITSKKFRLQGNIIILILNPIKYNSLFYVYSHLDFNKSYDFKLNYELEIYLYMIDNNYNEFCNYKKIIEQRRKLFINIAEEIPSNYINGHTGISDEEYMKFQVSLMKKYEDYECIMVKYDDFFNLPPKIFNSQESFFSEYSQGKYHIDRKIINKRVVCHFIKNHSTLFYIDLINHEIYYYDPHGNYSEDNEYIEYVEIFTRKMIKENFEYHQGNDVLCATYSANYVVNRLSGMSHDDYCESEDSKNTDIMFELQQKYFA